MSSGYNVSTDSLIHLTILEDSFSPATCSLVANFTGQTKNSFKKFYNFFYWSFFIVFRMKLFYFQRGDVWLTWGWDDVLPILGRQAEHVAHHLAPAGLALPVPTAVPLTTAALKAANTNVWGWRERERERHNLWFMWALPCPHTKSPNKDHQKDWLELPHFCSVEWYQDIFYLISSCLTPSLELSLP